MLLKDNHSKEYLEYFFDKYAEKYKDIINGKIYYKLKEIVTDGLYYDEVPAEISQMYHEYNLIRKELDYYNLFKNELVKLYPDLKKRNIVDVGAGIVPQLSKELAKITEKDVFAVDRHITQNTDGLSNLIPVEGEFNDKTTLIEKDLIVGLHPCEATIDIVKKAAEYNIDFAIVVCDCYKRNLADKRFIDLINLKNNIQDIVDESDLGNVNNSQIGLSPLIYTNKNRR